MLPRPPFVQSFDAEPANISLAASAVRAELQSVLSGKHFAGALAHQRLLRHLVERTLAGQTDSLKETVLAIEVFQRPADRFDPRLDSIVRVEARRLRERLRRHYEQQQPTRQATGLMQPSPLAGTSRALMIDLPKGSYHPCFVPLDVPPLGTSAAPKHALGHLLQNAPDGIPEDVPQMQAATGPNLSPHATELVDRGQYFLRQGHEEGHRKALARFEEAARLEPLLAAAHSGVARAWVQLVTTNIEPPLPGVQQAMAAVNKALLLQPGHADSLVLAAQLTHRFEFDWPSAQVFFDRAMQAAPRSPRAAHAQAFAHMVRGEFDAAQALLTLARRHDPLHLTLRAHQALLYLYQQRWDAAELELQAMLDMSPHNVLGSSLMATVLLMRGQAALALTMFEGVAAQHPHLSIGPIGKAQALALLGRADAARQQLQLLHQHTRRGYLSPYQLAMVHERLGERERALAELARAITERDPNAVCLAVDPTFEALRLSPLAQVLVQQVLGKLPAHTPDLEPQAPASPVCSAPQSA